MSALAVLEIPVSEDAAVPGGFYASTPGHWAAFPLGINGQDDGSGGPVGVEDDFHGSSQKSYLRFDLSTLTQDAVAATFKIDRGSSTLALVNVWGLVGSVDSWTDAGTSWDNAPGNETNSSTGMLAGSVYGGVPLGSFLHDTPTTLTFSNDALVDYINSERTDNGGDNNITIVLTSLANSGFFYNEEDVLSKAGRLQLVDNLLGDFDKDGNITTLDYDILKANWLTTGNEFNENGEVTDDGVVNIDDFARFKEELFPGPASALASAVPEPSMLLLILTIIPAWRIRSRRRYSF